MLNLDRDMIELNEDPFFRLDYFAKSLNLIDLKHLHKLVLDRYIEKSFYLEQSFNIL
jgi:hypothetical protein